MTARASGKDKAIRTGPSIGSLWAGLNSPLGKGAGGDVYGYAEIDWHKAFTNNRLQ